MSVDELLPGEASLSKSRILTHVPLDAFKRLEGWPKHFDRFFLQLVFCNSAARRTNAGPSGMVVEAARDILGHMRTDLNRLYDQRDIILLIRDPELDRLANELAAEMMKRPSFRNETIVALKSMREDIAANVRQHESDEYLSAYNEIETAIGTLNRWLYYVETQIEQGKVRNFFGVQRLLISCLRVYDAVFGTNNLHLRIG